MRLAWLCQLLLGAGAASALGKLEIGDTILGSEGTVLRGRRDITYPGHDNKAAVSQRGSGEGASIHSASASMISVDLDPLNTAQAKNLTKPQPNIQPREPARPNHQAENARPIITHRTDTNSHQTTEPHHNPAPDPGQVAPRSTPPKEDGARTPASANRAIAGMGAGLASVTLVFFVFL